MPAAWFARGARERNFLRRKSAAAKVSCFDFLAENPRVCAIIQAAGWPIWFLLLASVIAVALIIERSIVLRQAKIVPNGLLDKVVDAYRKQGVTPQLLDSLYQDSPLGRVLASGLTATARWCPATFCTATASFGTWSSICAPASWRSPMTDGSPP